LYRRVGLDVTRKPLREVVGEIVGVRKVFVTERVERTQGGKQPGVSYVACVAYRDHRQTQADGEANFEKEIEIQRGDVSDDGG